MTDRAGLISKMKNLAAQLRWDSFDRKAKIVEEAIAALEAKPEPAKPLPESDEQWIQKHKACPLEVPRFQDVLYVGDVIDYLTELHSQHQAELAKLNDLIHRQRDVEAQLQGEVNELEAQLTEKDAEIADWKAGAAAGARLHDEARMEIAAAREQGRREAIEIIEQYRVPVGNSPAGELARDWTLQALREIRDEIADSARDAQEGGGG